jgi:hypothetical protein
MRALTAGFLVLAVALTVDLVAFGLDASAANPFGQSAEHSYLLTSAAYTIGVLSLVCFAKAEPPRRGPLARRTALVFWALIGASAVLETLWLLSPRLDLRGSGSGHAWQSLAFLAAWAALGWAVAVRPIASRVSWVGAVLAGIGSVVLLVLALGYSWDSAFGENDLFSLAALLAFFALALSLGAQRQPLRLPG